MASSIALALLGLSLGSFLNVVTLRYRPERPLFSFRDTGGRSRCASCGKELRWFELLPLVSFLVQRGRCRACHTPLSLQYPLVEAVSALVVMGAPYLLAIRSGIAWGIVSSGAAPWWFYVLSILWIAALLLLVTIALVDARHFLIPNGANLSLAVIGALITCTLAWAALPLFQTSSVGSFALMAGAPESPFLNHLLGAVAGAVAFALLWGCSRGRAMGFGDVKLAAAAGMLLGWPDIALATALSFVIGGAWGGVLLVLRRNKPKDHIPFGPFFVVGTICTFAWGTSLLRWYFGIFPG